MSSVVYTNGNDPPETMRAQLIDLRNQRPADAIDLDTEARQAHWNVKGPQFIALHKLFDEVYAAVEEYVDLLVERLVQLGGIAAGTARIVAERAELLEYPHTIADGPAHVSALARAPAKFGGHIRRAELGDADTGDICTELSRGIDKWLWLVEAHVQAPRQSEGKP